MGSLEDTLLDTLVPKNASAVCGRIAFFLQRSEFVTFAQDHVDKISAKLRRALNESDQFDVLAELEFAYLIGPHVLCIEYEPCCGNERAPDFHLQIAESSHVAAEVTRIRETPAAIECYKQLNAKIPYTQKESFKFTDIILDKLKQLRPDMPNIIFIRSNSLTHEAREVDEAFKAIRQRYMSNDIQFFKRKGYMTLNEFSSYMTRLSAIVARDDSIPIPGIGSEILPRNLVRTYSDAAPYP